MIPTIHDKKKKRHHRIIDPIDAAVSAHFSNWKKPLTRVVPGPFRNYSIITKNSKAGRSSFITVGTDKATDSDRTELYDEEKNNSYKISQTVVEDGDIPVRRHENEVKDHSTNSFESKFHGSDFNNKNDLRFRGHHTKVITSKAHNNETGNFLKNAENKVEPDVMRKESTSKSLKNSGGPHRNFEGAGLEPKTHAKEVVKTFHHANGKLALENSLLLQELNPAKKTRAGAHLNTNDAEAFPSVNVQKEKANLIGLSSVEPEHDVIDKISFHKGPVGAGTLFEMDPRRDKMGQRTFHEVTGDNVCPSMIRGIDFLRDPKLNKGMAFTLEERQALGIHGLLPPRFKTQEEQVKLCKENVERYTEDLNKYIYLVGLQDRNERLFYRLIAENVEAMMPLVYTPTVGLACQKFGLIYRRPRGLFITIHDKGHIYQVLRNWPEPDVRAIVVTDGERILGLGDLGAYGMGIPVGKLALYTALAGIKPHQCLPILLDVGTNTQSLLDDPYYIGLRHKRVTGPEYDEFIDEFMQAVVRRYGQNTLIQFEDFGNHNAFRMLAKYRDRYCTFNDDIQGTASVAVAGILAALRITKNQLKDHKFLFFGAGEAAIGIAMLITQAMVKNDGVTADEAASRIFLSDSKGLVVKSRSKELTVQKQMFMKDLPHISSFEEMVDAVKPTAILGAAATKGAFTPKVIKRMAELNERPIIFALSNPTSKAECTAAEAYEHSDCRAIFASGSPFPIYEHKGKKFEPGQGNNAYIFPGVALAAIAANIHHINENVFLLSAQALANIVTEKDLDVGRLYPPLTEIQNVSVLIAKKIMEDAYEKGVATTYPEPADKEEFLKAQLYNFRYTKALPQNYTWPAI